MSQPSLIFRFTQHLEEVLDKFRDEGITIGEVIGALEIFKAGIIKDGLEDAQEGEEPWKT